MHKGENHSVLSTVAFIFFHQAAVSGRCWRQDLKLSEPLV